MHGFCSSICLHIAGVSHSSTSTGSFYIFGISIQSLYRNMYLLVGQLIDLLVSSCLCLKWFGLPITRVKSSSIVKASLFEARELNKLNRGTGWPNKKLLVTSASLLVTSALLVVTMFAINLNSSRATLSTSRQTAQGPFSRVSFRDWRLSGWQFNNFRGALWLLWWPIVGELRDSNVKELCVGFVEMLGSTKAAIYATKWRWKQMFLVYSRHSFFDFCGRAKVEGWLHTSRRNSGKCSCVLQEGSTHCVRRV